MMSNLEREALAIERQAEHLNAVAARRERAPSLQSSLRERLAGVLFALARRLAPASCRIEGLTGHAHPAHIDV